MFTRAQRLLGCLAASLTLVSLSSVASAQNAPTSQFQGQQQFQQPVAQQFQGQVQQQIAGQPFGGQQVIPNNLPAKAAQALQQGHVYKSQRWLASFYLEERLQIPGSPVFSAGRIVEIQPGSPLQQIGLNVGDVVTRLDGTRVADGKWPNQQGCFWMLPELERHFGMTRIRFIRRGTATVEEPTVNLGPRCRPQPIPASLLP